MGGVMGALNSAFKSRSVEFQSPGLFQRGKILSSAGE
jgi:hypothetical protein